ncbi:hypothetical protein VTK26DRAFT_6966 [Humicola hyalothermophila]
MACPPSSGSSNIATDKGRSETSGSLASESLDLTQVATHRATPGTGSEKPAAVGGGAVPATPANGAVPSIRMNTGWRPWKVVLGCFCLTIPTFGLLSTIGLFQTHWHQSVLQERSEGEIAWIISIFGFLDCLFASPAGILFDRYGLKWLLPLGCVAYIASFIGLAFASTYGQFMGCMALSGISAAIPTTVAFSVVSQWFQEREGLATGCVTLGAPLGGIFFSLLLQTLFDGFPWRTAALVLAGVLAAFVLLGILMVEANVPQQTASGDTDESSTTAKVPGILRCSKFWLISYAVFAYELILFIQWGSVPSYAVSANAGNVQFYLMMSYNIGALLGRTVPPWLSDRGSGPMNTTILMNMFTLLVVLTVWLPVGASSVPALFIVIVLMGIGTGSLVPLGVSCVNALCDPQSIGTWLGSVYSIASVATLIGNPASEAMLSRYGPQGLVAFLAAVLFSGMISTGTLRWIHLGRRWALHAQV